MKRFVITISCLLGAALLLLACYYVGGVYVPRAQEEPVFFARARVDSLELRGDAGWERFELRGVDLGSSEPAAWSTDYAIDEETYLRWFTQMQEMGANTVRVYSVQGPAFYRALKAFNEDAAAPLWLLQGVWVDDYVQNSRMDAYDAAFGQKLIEDCRATVDAVHGKRFQLGNDARGSAGLFLADVSPWVLGYVIGAEWTDVTVAYTDEKYPDAAGYEGAYLSTGADATAFETLLAQAGDALLSHEAARYGEQRLLSFANTRTTDPFTYPQEVTEFFRKCATIDIEHLRASDALKTGIFASYSVYSFDLDYLAVMDAAQWGSLTEKTVDFSDCDGSRGEKDTYLAYLKLLNAHHSVPVAVIAFGASSGRGLAQYNAATGSHEGHVSETEQGAAIVENWRDILSAGCAGGCVFSWQDEWSRKTWNTMFSVDSSRSAFWRDVQSSDQHFGLLSFDAGKESVCVVDGAADEWRAEDAVITYADGSRVSARYDESYLYLLVERPGYVFGEETLYLPIDTTQKTGSRVCPAYGLRFDCAADFLIKLHSAEDSALLVQDRYHAIHANFEQEITGEDAYLDPPAKDSPCFEVAELAVKDAVDQFWGKPATLGSYATGRLRCGNADPKAADYDSLTDFSVGEGIVELRIPWALLNFADPSRMQIHDDYYDGNYGVSFLSIKALSVGLGCRGEEIGTGTLALKGWRNDATWHERLKPAYDALRACWAGGEAK